MFRKGKFKMPHSYVIIFMMIVLAFIMGNLIDAGEFERITDAAGNTNRNASIWNFRFYYRFI